MEMQFDPGYGDMGMDAADFSASGEASNIEASAEWDATLDTSFPEASLQDIADGNLDSTLDQNLPETTESPKTPDDSDDPAPRINPGGPETEPTPETEPIREPGRSTRIEPPPGWTPGGPEHLG